MWPYMPSTKVEQYCFVRHIQKKKKTESERIIVVIKKN